VSARHAAAKRATRGTSPQRDNQRSARVVRVVFGGQPGYRNGPRADFELDLAFAQRCALQRLHERSIDANDLATAKLALIAARAVDPWRTRVDQERKISPLERKALRKCEPLLRRHCAHCGEPGAWLCSTCEPLFEAAAAGGAR
jgi:hypothetical protein